ncbi:hypothetical protein BD560DRAFT_487159 [Blakeslea trispora]|nr:hypothetical protein BD560DRAFT_487159 [Blakeslea trispora]
MSRRVSFYYVWDSNGGNKYQNKYSLQWFFWWTSKPNELCSFDDGKEEAMYSFQYVNPFRHFMLSKHRWLYQSRLWTETQVMNLAYFFLVAFSVQHICQFGLRLGLMLALLDLKLIKIPVSIYAILLQQTLEQ